LSGTRDESAAGASRGPRADRAGRDTLGWDASAAEALRKEIRDRATVGATGRWRLVSVLAGGTVLPRAELTSFPFRIGRRAGLDLVLDDAHVSKAHAEIYSDGAALRIRDLGSRNGTYVNMEPIADAPLHESDTVRIGEHEFRVVPAPPSELADTVPLQRHIQAMRVAELLDQEAVRVEFQPIVALDGRAVVAYEAFGRGTFPDLPRSPVELLDLAGALGPEPQARLSRLFRRKAVQAASGLAEPPRLFLNSHPADFEQPGLVASLEQLRTEAPDVACVLEVHESALADTDLVSWLRDRLAALGMQLAVSHFGAGEARLLELSQAPPDYLKFDRRFVTGLDAAAVPRRRLVAALVAAARGMGVRTVAEGVQLEAEAKECVEAGFSLAQGFHFGPPGALP
jgi:EAL domain-containing protein (putative c-di-GMP-specific phosphodiesterase class I)